MIGPDGAAAVGWVEAARRNRDLRVARLPLEGVSVLVKASAR